MNNTSLPKALENAIEHFSSLPGIGKKTAFRLAFSLLQKTPQHNEKFANSILNLQENISYCKTCFHMCNTQEEECSICTNHKRSKESVCIVETSLDLLALEKSNSYFGQYFVLGGVLSPMEGIGPEEIRIDLFLEYLEKNKPEEIIFALSSTMEGEATTTFIAQKIEAQKLPGKISRIARGIPLGSSLQYTDENTLLRAFEGRQGM